MKALGRIVRLQIQRASLKPVIDGRKVYDPEPILAVAELTLSPAGACARLQDGSFILDVHHAAHPETRNSGKNPLSLLFTRHYASMQERFGPHLTSGCAGENILIETGEMISIEDLANGAVIDTRNGPVSLGGVVVAAPCKSFSAYALVAPAAEPEALKPALQFLDRGMRGFYCQLVDAGPVTVAVGDSVFAR